MSRDASRDVVVVVFAAAVAVVVVVVVLHRPHPSRTARSDTRPDRGGGRAVVGRETRRGTLEDDQWQSVADFARYISHDQYASIRLAGGDRALYEQLFRSEVAADVLERWLGVFTTAE